MTAKALKHICKNRGLIQSGRKPELVARLEGHDRRTVKRKLQDNDIEEQNESKAAKRAKPEKKCSVCLEYHLSFKFKAFMHSGITKAETEKHKRICLNCCRLHVLSKLNDNVLRDNMICPAEHCNTHLTDVEARKLVRGDKSTLNIFETKPVWSCIADIPSFRVCNYT
ncbi:hypothetical protein FKW77_009917 [Venturia effusa]|uniref:SAP domain-containing protein n=1 Tax=Venturia effusa TaxID=50376 RepID=A0A517L265_9PEZI|nr:hypothetical protein FKW77_009917 [Venturia effusa]